MLGYAAANLVDIVRPEKLESWQEVVKDWFSDDTIRSQKTPGAGDTISNLKNCPVEHMRLYPFKGLLKTEKKITSGNFVALTPKLGF